jgi:N-acyl homoserine lactone hydrolase
MARIRIAAQMAVKALHALQNGFLGAQRSLLFYGEFSEAAVQIPVTCYLVRTSDALIVFDTGVSPRAIPGLMRSDRLAQFTEPDLLENRLKAAGVTAADVDMVVLSHLHYDHAGGAELFKNAELVVQKDEYSYALYPASFFAGFYYRKNFDIPGAKWRLLDGDTELAPGVTVLRTDGHTPGHHSLMVNLPETGPVILTGDACYWHEHVEKERVPGVVWNPTLALHSIKRLKTLARLTSASIFPSHDPVFWKTVKQAPDFYR